MQVRYKKWIKWALLGALGLLVVLQLIPYGRSHTNPAVVAEPAWDSPQTRELAVAACFACHSNETTWPWYSNLAPVSWLVQHDVDEGRARLNFSEWDQPQRAREIAEVVLEKEMPPRYFLITHPEARLSDAELQTLADGLTRTLGN